MMTFPDEPYEKAANEHRSHKENGVEKKEGCKMCEFYSDDEKMSTVAQVKDGGILWEASYNKVQEGDELVRIKDVIDHLEVEDLIDQLATAHRHMDEHNIEGEARETNERLQRKLEELLEEIE